MRPTQLTLLAREQGLLVSTVKQRLDAGMTLDDALRAPRMQAVKPSCRDITGQTFGHLTVLRAHEKRRNGGRQWVCLCVCGNKAVVTTSLLRSGQRTACGCKAIGFKTVSGTRSKDVSGQRFGMLVAERLSGDGRSGAMWQCVCDCGNKKVVKLNSLQSGMTRSCGCLRRGNDPIERSLLGQRFGRLIVRSLVNGDSATTRQWECLCDCGVVSKSVREHCLLSGNTSSCGKCGNRRYMLHGKTLSSSELASMAGIPAYTMSVRLRAGWSVERAMSTPVRTGSYRREDCAEHAQALLPDGCGEQSPKQGDRFYPRSHDARPESKKG